MALSILSTAANWWQTLKNKLSSAYVGILDKLKSPFVGLGNYFNQKDNQDKKAIDTLRQSHFDLIAKEFNSAKPDFNKTTKKITQDTKAFIQNILDEEIKKLGKPPCEFNVVTLGSMARQESGPITDLEIGFLLKEKTVASYQYFQQLAQNVSDRLFLLGEHPDIGGKGLRMDEADNAPPHLRFFARNATPEQAQQLVSEALAQRQFDKIPFEGSRPYLATFEEFANFSASNFAQNKQQLKKDKEAAFEREWLKAKRDPKNKQRLKTAKGEQAIKQEIRFWLDKMYRPFNMRELKTANEAGKKLGRNMDLLYGNPKLYQQFIQKREQHFKQKQPNGLTHRQNIAKSKMIEDIQDIHAKGKSVYLTGELGKTLDIKRELYRFVEQFVTNLGFYHHAKHQNTIDIVHELKNKGILSSTLATNLEDFIQFASGLRLKEQSVIKRQGFTAYFDQAEFDEDKEKLEKEIKNMEASIAYLQSGSHQPELMAAKQRDLVKLKVKLEHMLDMAPGKIYSPQDIQALKTKYLPMAKSLFKEATDWTNGKEKLGFESIVKPALSLFELAKAKTQPLPKPKPLTSSLIAQNAFNQKMAVGR
jgi:hypothetical protein